MLAILWSPLFSHYSTIYDGLARLISYISPPITAVFLLGVFWKRASGRGAYITLVTGGLLGATMFALDFFGRSTGRWLSNHGVPGARELFDAIYRIAVKDFMLTAFCLLLVCCAVLVAASLRYPEPLKDEARELVWDDWRAPLRAAGSYRMVAAAVAATLVILYVVFS